MIDGFYFKTSQSAKNYLASAKIEIGPKSDKRPI